MDIKHIGVLGAGIMGCGIAQTAAQSGFSVSMVDLEEKALRDGMEKIRGSLQRFKDKGKMTEIEVGETLARIKPSRDIEGGMGGVDMVIEAVPEILKLKKEVFRQLDRTCPKAAILATNTSSLSVTEIASATERPDKVVGMHFANPVPIMVGVEVIQGLETSETTVAAVYSLAERLGKVCYKAKDFPGFVGNRLLMSMINEGFQVLWQGISSAEDIDRACKISFRHPMGPLELADFIGLDTVVFILEYLHQEIGERYRPCPLLKQLVMAGQLGVKTKKGVYDYTKGEKKPRSF
ncbi:MAG: 3-hydroxybutyryl-CoA dehydrogenase [Deltaproteobacteria bacterium RBG_13_52_11b]|nr:MAG: 3-hydroxybutyryl-CoA dehydrogenase [Deltaproteobacteria bacterium RBG_13_52_11b]